MEETMKAGSSSYIANMPPNGLMRKFHTKTITPPEIMPETAPLLVVLFQNREKSMRGPNVAPKPAHAKLTIVNMTLLHPWL